MSLYSAHIPRCQHIKTNGTQCGSPALHRKRFCYFHNRWRGAAINLKRASTARSAGIFELPVLEDADSIQVALMQVLRLILSRQLDQKIGGLILYGLQTASANLRNVNFEPLHKQYIIIDPRTVTNSGVGDKAWAREDFEEEVEEENHVARTCPESTSKEPSPTMGVTAELSLDLLSKPKSMRRAEFNRPNEAIPAVARHDNLRDLKTFFKIAGIYPPRLNSSSTSDPDDK